MSDGKMVGVFFRPDLKRISGNHTDSSLVLAYLLELDSQDAQERNIPQRQQTLNVRLVCDILGLRIREFEVALQRLFQLGLVEHGLDGINTAYTWVNHPEVAEAL